MIDIYIGNEKEFVIFLVFFILYMECWWNWVFLGLRKGLFFGNVCKGCVVRFFIFWFYFMLKYVIFDFCCKIKYVKFIFDIVLELSCIDKECMCDNGNWVCFIFYLRYVWW